MCPRAGGEWTPAPGDVVAFRFPVLSITRRTEHPISLAGIPWDVVPVCGALLPLLLRGCIHRRHRARNQQAPSRSGRSQQPGPDQVAARLAVPTRAVRLPLLIGQDEFQFTGPQGCMSAPLHPVQSKQPHAGFKMENGAPNGRVRALGSVDLGKSVAHRVPCLSSQRSRSTGRHRSDCPTLRNGISSRFQFSYTQLRGLARNSATSFKVMSLVNLSSENKKTPEWPRGHVNLEYGMESLTPRLEHSAQYVLGLLSQLASRLASKRAQEALSASLLQVIFDGLRAAPDHSGQPRDGSGGPTVRHAGIGGGQHRQVPLRNSLTSQDLTGDPSALFELPSHVLQRALSLWSHFGYVHRCRDVQPAQHGRRNAPGNVTSGRVRSRLHGHPLRATCHRAGRPPHPYYPTSLLLTDLEPALICFHTSHCSTTQGGPPCVDNPGWSWRRLSEGPVSGLDG